MPTSFEITPEHIETMVAIVAEYGFRILYALAIFLIGRFISKRIINALKGLMEKRNVDQALITFLGSVIYYAFMAVILLAALSKVGVETTSFIAMLGAAGLAVGLALQGSLSNFAAGILIILFRPFRVGNFIEGGGAMGSVKEINMLVTVLATPDNKMVIVPNSAIMSANIVNFNGYPTRRVDLTFGISYDDDFEKAKAILTDIVVKHPKVLADPAPTIRMMTHAESSINIVVRPWVSGADYWAVYYDITEQVKARFDAEGISIPYPQRDVHVYTIDKAKEGALVQ